MTLMERFYRRFHKQVVITQPTESCVEYHCEACGWTTQHFRLSSSIVRGIIDGI